MRAPLPSLLLLILLFGACGFVGGCGDDPAPVAPPTQPPPGSEPAISDPVPPEEDLGTKLAKNCALCHRLPPPEVLPKEAWRRTVDKMFRLANVRLTGVYEHRILGYTPEEAAAWYAERAPESFGILHVDLDATRTPPRYAAGALRPAESSGKPPGGCNVRLLRLEGPGSPLRVVVSDMLAGRVMVGDPLAPDAPLRTIATLAAPSRVSLADLDGDGHDDLLVACLGDAGPTDERLGSIVWLRRTAEGTYEAHELATRLGRVADVQVADLDEDGDLDIAAAVFGWYSTGEMLVLWNVTPEGASKPVFERESLDQRSGAMNVPVLDVDGDGDLDLVTIYSQEHERVVAYVQVIPGKFAARDLWIAPYPHWGHTNIEPADLDGDGDIDFIVTNGDTLDDAVKLKPYHGVAWLENRGDLDFAYQRLLAYPGAHVARAADVDGDGDLDIVVGAFLPTVVDTPETPLPPGLVLLEQTSPGEFAAIALREGRCSVVTLDTADLDEDGRPDFVTGTLVVQPPFPEDWENIVEVLRAKGE